MMVHRVPGFRRPELISAIIALLAVLLAFDVPGIIKVAVLVAGFVAAMLGGSLTGVCLVGVALPLSSTTIAVGNTEWGPLELALLATGMGVGAAMVMEFADSRSLSALLRWIGPVDLAALGLILLALGTVSLLWVADADLRSDSVRAFRRVIIEPLIMIPAVAAVLRGRDESAVVRWLVWPAVGTAVLAIAQVVVQRSTVDIGGISRPIGTFTHPNNLAFYLERIIWFSPLVARPLTRRYGRAGWLVVALVLIATLLTLSRGAVIALAVGGVVMFWEVVHQRWRIFVVLLMAAASAVFASRYVAQTGDSLDSRATIWRGAIDMIRDHPITGVGLDQFLGQYGRRYVRPDGWPERYTSHPHNILLDFWLSLGIAGIAVLWLLIEVTWRRVTGALQTPAWSLQRAGIAAVTAGFAHGMIDNSFFLPALATMTWLGLSLGGAHQEVNVDE